jgi:DNA-binding transcriptional LysR family regulator
MLARAHQAMRSRHDSAAIARRRQLASARLRGYLAGVKISLRGLESFREIMRKGSATAAARELSLSQPAVSRLIGQLERELGFNVFDRIKGRLVPTQQGLLLYEEVESAFLGLERVSTVARDVHDLNAGQLRIVAPPSLAEGPLVGIIGTFIKKYPNVRVVLDSNSRPTAMNMIATRAADCGFGKLPLEHPGIHKRPLVVNETACVVPRGHRLARKPTVSATDLASEELIMIGRGSDTRLRIEAALRAAGVVPRIRLETHNVGAACAFVAAGVGITLVNDMLARAYCKREIELRPFRPRIIHEYIFMTSSGASASPLTLAFYAACRDALHRYHAA